LFSTGRDDAPASASHMHDENKELHRRVRLLEEIAAGVEAQNLLNEARPDENGICVITHVFDEKDLDSLKKVAHALTANAQTIALLSSRDKGAIRLVFARSSDAGGDMNELMKIACGILDGRGGGRPDMAQGGGKNLEKTEEALAAAAAKLG